MKKFLAICGIIILFGICISCSLFDGPDDIDNAVHVNYTDTSKWELCWNDEFNGNSLDTVIWHFEERNANVLWRKYLTSNNVCCDVSDSCLVLKTMTKPLYFNDTVDFLSVGISTRKSFKVTTNMRIEARIRQNGGFGDWSAFWLIADSNTKTNIPGDFYSEIDVMEQWHSTGVASSIIHTAYTLSTKSNISQSCSARYSLNWSKFNIFSVELYSDSTLLYLNDKMLFKYCKEQLLGVDEYKVYPFDKLPMVIMLDNVVDPLESPRHLFSEMIIDWVRVYKLKVK